MDKPFEGWAILELMGHRERSGYVKEVEMAGSKFIRIDIPIAQDEVGQDASITEFYSPSAVYSLRPCAEDVIRDAAKRWGRDPRPVRPVEYRDPPKPAAIAHEAPENPSDPIPF